MAQWKGLRRALETPFDTPRTALLVTAHPDDEYLFFLPTLQGLHDQGAQDGKQRRWDSALVAEHIARAVTKFRTEVVQPRCCLGPFLAGPRLRTVCFASLGAPAQVITFDAGGVSGHANHVAAHRGALEYVRRSRRVAPVGHTPPQGQAMPHLWFLETTSCARKFLGPLDVPWSALGAWRQARASPVLRPGPCRTRACYVSRDVRAALAAMRAHRSQWVWFRWLFLWLSRYTYVNTLRALSVAND